MKIFVLTGAGVSAESGLGTFRDPEGIWARFDPMKLATPEAFASDPEQVHEFYNMRRRALVGAQPNAAHSALARLESKLASRDGDPFLCTQNIDDLHERGGSQRVIHMHGELLKARCTGCEIVVEWRQDLGTADVCLHCSRAGTMRPHVVWFGEMPLRMDEIENALHRADLFVAIGTSGSVYPAAGFVSGARTAGRCTIFCLGTQSRSYRWRSGPTGLQRPSEHSIFNQTGPLRIAVGWLLSSISA